jgi:predicted permease
MWMKRLRLRVRAIIRRTTLERDLEQELRFHMAEQKAEFLSQGMTDAEAELAVRRSFGFAFRTLWRAPGFTWTAVATLALGVGANVAFFSASYGVLFRPLPYPEPDRLVELNLGFAGVGPTTALRDLSGLVDYAGYLANVETTAQLGGEAVRLRTATVTWNLARVLSVAPALGRWFEASEEKAGQHRVIVVSHRMWQERWGGDPSILGKQIMLNEEPFEVVGVMPPRFAFPAPSTEAWTPIRIDPSSRGYMWGDLNLWPIGRLKKGATLAASQAELRPAVDRIRPMFPWRMPDAWGTSSSLVLHSAALVKDSRPKMLALAAASLLLLLIACGNVASLLLTRWVRRDREFAVREALGAGRGRLLRQVIAENGVLAGLGGAVGLATAWAFLSALPVLLGEVPRLQELAVGPDVAMFAIATMMITFGLLSLSPILRSKLQPSPVASSGRNTAHGRSHRISMGLASLQLALATALLIGAGLMGRTLWQLAHVDSGVRASRVVAGTVSAGASRCGTPDRCWAFLQDLNATLGAVPGVRSVNWSNGIPLVKQTSAMSVDLEDHRKEPGAPAFVFWHVTATPGYFGALGITLRAGRLFSDADTSTSLPVAIINESAARRFWPKESPLGKTIRPVSGKVGRTVVGVVADVAHYSLDGFPSWIDGVQYVPFHQSPPRSAKAVQLSLLIEAGGIQNAELHNAIRKRFPDVVVSGLQSISEVRDASVSNRRSTAWLLSLLAGLGLMLGVVGVYGVLTQRAAQRTREMGIRIALGASARGIAALVLREALLIGVTGSLIGVLAALGLSRFLRTLLFGVAANDPVAYFSGPAILVATALIAAGVPAYRASRVDPVQTLRSE